MKTAIHAVSELAAVSEDCLKTKIKYALVVPSIYKKRIEYNIIFKGF